MPSRNINNLLSGFSFSDLAKLVISCCCLTEEKLFKHTYKSIVQARVVQRLDNAIHRMNLYPVDNGSLFNTLPLDSDVSVG